MAREDLRMSPDQVAALLGVNPSTIYKIERGRWNVSVGYLISLAKIYGLSLEFVYPNGDILEETKKTRRLFGRLVFSGYLCSAVFFCSLCVTSLLFVLPKIKPIMKEEVFYYDGFGQPCKKEDAWSMHIVSEEGMGVIAGCNGHQAGERRVLSQDEEIDILKPWAAGLPEKFDIVKLWGKNEEYRFYKLVRSWLRGHKTGMPVLAIVENGIPRLLDYKEPLYSIGFDA